MRIKSAEPKITRMKPKALQQAGFSIVEVLMAAVLMVVGLIALAQFLSSASSRVVQDDIRSVLHQVANEEMERIRGLPYEDVGVEGGTVDGVLAPTEDREVDGVAIRVDRSVLYQTDPTYEGPYYANYRRVSVTVTALDADGDPGAIAPFRMTSYVAGGASGGAIMVRVQDASGAPVEDAYFTIVNSVKGINYVAGDQLTDDTGTMLVPGLTVDPDGNYVVTASKAGYSTDVAEDFPVLEAGLQEVVLTIDRWSSMNVHVINDATGLELEGILVSVIGPANYSNVVQTGATGFTLSNLRFSTEGDPYIVRVMAGQGYLPQQIAVTLPPNAVDHQVVLRILPNIVTTTTLAAVTTTTSPSVTTTLAGTGSLRVTVREYDGSWDGRSLRSRTRAIVQLGTVSKSSHNNIVLFSNLQLASYPLLISAPGYYIDERTVTISGADILTVYLYRR